MPSQGRVTLTDVAARANVDRSVVSRVINHDPRLNVREETRLRVIAAIDELGYTPNPLARSLRTARAGAFGLVIPDFANPIYAAVIKGAEAEAAVQDSLLLTASSNGEQATLRRHLARFEGRVEGVLLAGSRGDRGRRDGLDQIRIPWLLVNRRRPGSKRYVILNDEAAAGLAVRHLADLGHERIAHLAGDPRADTASRRRTGYQRAMAKCGARVREGYIVEADYTNEGGAAAMRALLRVRPRPTAVFVANVASAIGALHVLRERGVRVPDEMSVVAVHDLPLAGYLAPPLTTVSMPLEQLGTRGIELLAGSAAADPIEEVVDGPMTLVARASSGSPP